MHEQCGQEWAKEMIDCLLGIKQVVDQTRDVGDRLCEGQLEEFERRYQKILEMGYAENPIPPPPPGKKKRGRPKKSKARNLLERLDDYRKETLAFMYDFRVPFDNNQAERDGRMAKVQQKISGTFRRSSDALSDPPETRIEGHRRDRHPPELHGSSRSRPLEALLHLRVRPRVVQRPPST